MKPWWRDLLLPAVGVCGCIAALRPVAGRLFHRDQERILMSQTIPLESVPRTLVPVITFGHKNVYDDIVHIWLIQSLLDQRFTAKPDVLVRQIESVIEKRPAIETLYMLSCFIAMKDLQRPELCQSITIAGLEVFPNSWRLPMTQGFVHAFILNEPMQAASFYLLAASRPNSPSYVQRVAEKLAAKETVNEDDYQHSLELMFGPKHAEEFRQLLEKSQHARGALAP